MSHPSRFKLSEGWQFTLVFVGALLVWSLLAALQVQQRTALAATRPAPGGFEIKILKHENYYGDPDPATLQALGAQGWHIVGVAATRGGYSHFIYLERKVW